MAQGLQGGRTNTSLHTSSSTPAAAGMGPHRGAALLGVLAGAGLLMLVLRSSAGDGPTAVCCRKSVIFALAELPHAPDLLFAFWPAVWRGRLGRAECMETIRMHARDRLRRPTDDFCLLSPSLIRGPRMDSRRYGVARLTKRKSL